MKQMDEHKKKILVLAIIGVLAASLIASIITIVVLVSSKPTKKDSTTTSSTTNQTTKDTKTQKQYLSTIDSSFGYKLSFVYPEAWELSTAVEGGMPATGKTPTIQSFTLISPTGNVMVTYKIGAGVKLGGACDPKTAGQFVTVRAEAVPGLPIVNLAEYTMRNYTAPYPNGPYYAGLMETSTVRLFATDGDVCTAFGANTVKLKDDKDVRLIDASIFVKNIHSIEDFTKAQSTSEYQDAKSILLSTVHQ